MHEIVRSYPCSVPIHQEKQNSGTIPTNDAKFPRLYCDKCNYLMNLRNAINYALQFLSTTKKNKNTKHLWEVWKYKSLIVTRRILSQLSQAGGY